MNESEISRTDALLNPNRRSFLKTAAAGGAIAAAGGLTELTFGGRDAHSGTSAGMPDQGVRAYG